MWETARGTNGPWYDQVSSQLIYQTNLVAGALLLAGLLVVSATAGRKSIITQGIGPNPETSYSEGDSGPSSDAGPENPGLSVEVSEELKSDIQWLDQEMENEFKSLFQSLQEPELAEAVTSPPSGSPGLRLVTVSDPSTFVAVVGPAILAMSYLAVSAIFLPGAGSFLTANFQLNTAAILVLSYGWPGLGLYAILSVYVALRPARDEAQSR